MTHHEEATVPHLLARVAALEAAVAALERRTAHIMPPAPWTRHGPSGAPASDRFGPTHGTSLTLLSSGGNDTLPGGGAPAVPFAPAAPADGAGGPGDR